MSEPYTPTTEEIIRSFSIPSHVIYPRGNDESFAEYLSRISIEGHGSQLENTAAAHRWLTEHDRQVRAEERDRIIGDLIGPETRLEATVRAFKQGWHLADIQGRHGERVAEGLRTVVADRIEYPRRE